MRSGPRSVAASGDIGNSVVVTGDGNVIHLDGTGALEAAKSEKSPAIDPSGRWISEEITNSYDKGDRYRYHFEIEKKGDIVLGAVRVASITRNYSTTNGLMDGRIKENVISFHTIEQSYTYGHEWQQTNTGPMPVPTTTTNIYKNYYYGTVFADRIEFTMNSDRPWGFPPQKFTATKE